MCVLNNILFSSTFCCLLFKNGIAINVVFCDLLFFIYPYYSETPHVVRYSWSASITRLYAILLSDYIIIAQFFFCLLVCFLQS